LNNQREVILFFRRSIYKGKICRTEITMSCVRISDIVKFYKLLK
jgi:hypothetical protein